MSNSRAPRTAPLRCVRPPEITSRGDGTGGDPVREGLVTRLNRPGGNATGTSVLTETLAAKRLELFRELVPRADVIALLVNPTTAPSLEQLRNF